LKRAGMPRFRDRRDAGRRLAERLENVRGEDAVVLGVPRGGVVVAHEIAMKIGAPLDVVVVRKLGYPGHEEAGFGALGEDGVLVPEALGELLNDDDPRHKEFRSVIELKQEEVSERVERYRSGRPPQTLEGRTAVVADDGVATGYTFAAALAIARRRSPGRLIAAAPAASWEGAHLISAYCDELIAIGTADRGLFFAVSLYYDTFPQVSDEEVVELLNPDGP
jgi:putative phosphoribosyl transferase